MTRKFSLILGVSLGLTAGYFGGKYEMIVMRITDVQLTVPSILMALLVDGIARGVISKELHDEMAIYVHCTPLGSEIYVKRRLMNVIHNSVQ